MASIELKGKYHSQFTMVMATFPFTYRLPQGSGQAEEKPEFGPYRWKVDIWHDCRVRFTSSAGGLTQGLGASLEVRDDGDIHIERGYTYLFGLADEIPAPVPEPEPTPEPEPPPPPPSPPQPEPTPDPQPPDIPNWPLPVPPAGYPRMLGVYGSPEIVRPLITFWGTGTWGTMEVVWTVPMEWYMLAWNKGMPTLLDKMNHAVLNRDYDVEHHTRG
jgi:hypothetical protein